MLFICEEINDTICLVLPSSGTHGGKGYGLEGVRRGRGDWYGEGYDMDDNHLFDIWGTWRGDFNYTTATPTSPLASTSHGLRGMRHPKHRRLF
jgi:hypothetical protein